MKSTPAGVANVPSLKPARKQAVPSEPEIATKAYEIWLAHGQASGDDQSHWFEAERQLRNA
jgi:ribonuclease I